MATKGKPFQKRQNRRYASKDGPVPCDKCYRSLPEDQEVHGRCVNCRSTHGDLTPDQRKESELRFKAALEGKPRMV